MQKQAAGSTSGSDGDSVVKGAEGGSVLLHNHHSRYLYQAFQASFSRSDSGCRTCVVLLQCCSLGPAKVGFVDRVCCRKVGEGSAVPPLRLHHSPGGI